MDQWCRPTRLTSACLLRPLLQVKPLFKRVHSQHHQIGSAITALGTALGDAADIGLCFVAFHLVLGAYLCDRARAWNVAAVVLLIIFEVRAGPCPSCAPGVCDDGACEPCMVVPCMQPCTLDEYCMLR